MRFKRVLLSTVGLWCAKNPSTGFLLFVFDEDIRELEELLPTLVVLIERTLQSRVCKNLGGSTVCAIIVRFGRRFLPIRKDYHKNKKQLSGNHVHYDSSGKCTMATEVNELCIKEAVWPHASQVVVLCVLLRFDLFCNLYNVIDGVGLCFVVIGNRHLLVCDKARSSCSILCFRLGRVCYRSWLSGYYFSLWRKNTAYESINEACTEEYIYGKLQSYSEPDANAKVSNA